MVTKRIFKGITEGQRVTYMEYINSMIDHTANRIREDQKQPPNCIGLMCKGCPYTGRKKGLCGCPEIRTLGRHLVLLQDRKY